jgi:HK97 family phage major capsid protein
MKTKKKLSEEQKSQLEALRKKQKEAFDAMMADEMTETKVNAWKLATKTLHDYEDNLDKEDKEEIETPAEIVEAEEHESLNEDAKTFLEKIREAVSVGSTYTGLVPSSIASEIVKKRETYGKFRPYCRKMTVAGDYTIAVDGDQATVDYVSEGNGAGEVTPSLTMVSFSAYKLGALIKVSNEFLNDVAVDAMNWLTDNIARAFAKKEDAEIIKGTGSTASHITGILTSVTANAKTAAAVDAVTLEEVKGLIDELGDYKDGAVLIMNPKTKTKLKLLKDDYGQYYFPIQQDLKEIEGLPIITTTNVDEMAADKRAIIAANLSYYQLVDRQGMDIKILSELYAVNDQKGILGFERLDGKPLIADAFKVLVMDDGV